MTLAPQRRDLAVAVFISLAVVLYLWFLFAPNVVRVLDEGIYYEGAVRILEGQAPYRDFFVLTGPGSFWILAGVFTALGPSLAHARLVPALDIALLTAAVYWLVGRRTTRLYGAWAATLWFLYFLAQPNPLVVNHRWDSSALAIAAAAALLARRPLLAGLLAAAAAWSTPPMILIILAVSLWPDARRELPRFLAGVALCSTAAGGVLAVQGALPAFVEHMLWTAGNYSQANSAFYGSIVGGYSALFGSAAPAALVPLAFVVLFCFLLPALLPPAAYLAWFRGAWTHRDDLFLLVVSIAVLASTYPRMNVPALRTIMPIFWVLAALLLWRSRLRAWIGGLLMMFGLIFFINTTRSARAGDWMTTAAGPVRAGADSARLIWKLRTHVQPGHSLFVYPYEPLVYALSGGRNPTRYSFVQPGMMTTDDEVSVVDSLRVDPPLWVYRADISGEAYLLLWPGSDPARLTMNRIDRFISANYRAVDSFRLSNARYTILRRRP